MSDSDDVFDLDDLRAVVGRATGRVGRESVAVAIVISLLGVSLAFGLVPHTLGAVGADPVDTGSTGGPPEEDVQQRYQNSMTRFVLIFAPAVLVVAGVAVAFAGALRATGSRGGRVARVVAATAVGVAAGYVLLLFVAHLGYGETERQLLVREYPVTLRIGSLLTNALALGVSAAIGSAIAAFAATLVAPDAADEAAAVEAIDGDEAEGGEAVDDDTNDDEASAPGGPSPSTDGGPASDDADGSAASGDADVGPASDYRDTGSTSTGGTPRYDPDDRDWDGRGEDS